MSDFSLGCLECGRLASTGQRDKSAAAEFDRFRPSPAHDLPLVLDFALSNRCNLECVMCSGYFSSRIRRNREGRSPIPMAYGDEFFDELEDFVPAVKRAHFKGGEPFLITENARVWDMLLAAGNEPEIAVTTNGTVWSERIEEYVRSTRMQLIISVDAVSPDRFESIRVGANAGAFWANVDRFQQAAAAAGAPAPTFSMCLMQENWHELGAVLDEADRRGLGVSVVWVMIPAQMDLLRLPPEELAHVHRALSEQRASRSDTPTTQPIWDEVLTRLENSLSKETPAAIRPGQNTRSKGKGGSRFEDPGDSTTEADGLLNGALTSWLEANPERSDPLVVRYEGDIAIAAEVPPWADFLKPEEWIGSGLQDLPRLISESAGGSTRLNVDDPGDGSLVGCLEVLTPPHACRLDFALMPIGGGHGVTAGYGLFIGRAFSGD